MSIVAFALIYDCVENSIHGRSVMALIQSEPFVLFLIRDIGRISEYVIAGPDNDYTIVLSERSMDGETGTAAKPIRLLRHSLLAWPLSGSQPGLSDEGTNEHDWATKQHGNTRRSIRCAWAAC